MNWTEVFKLADKWARVLSSCNTPEQFAVAKTYTMRVHDRIKYKADIHAIAQFHLLAQVALQKHLKAKTP